MDDVIKILVVMFTVALTTEVVSYMFQSDYPQPRSSYGSSIRSR